MSSRTGIQAISAALLRRAKEYILFCLAALTTVVLYFSSPGPAPQARLVVEFSVEKRDVLQLYYKPREDPWFSERNSMKIFIPAGSGMQTYSMAIPAGCDLENVRLDPGVNRQQQYADIGRIFIVYKADTLHLFGGEPRPGFMLNENMERTAPHRFRLFPSANGAFDPYMGSGDIGIAYGNMTVNEKKLPAYLLLPLLLALLLQLVRFARTQTFLSLFYVIAPCLFVGLLLLPVLNNLFGLYKDQNREKRILAKKPEFKEEAVFDYPPAFEVYFNDNFGFRSLLVSCGGRIKFYGFGASAAPSTAVVGKQGWMYLLGTFYHVTRDVQDGGLFADSTVRRLVKDWEQRRSDLSKDGTGYYKAFWPEKFTIYPEYLPWHLSATRKDSILRLDQVMRYMKAIGSPLQIIDITEELKQEKKNWQLYLRYDSHWNAFAAFMAYTALMEKAAVDFPDLKPHPVSDYDISFERKTGGDMADMLSVEESEMVPVFKLKNDPSLINELPFYNYPPNTLVFENKAASSALTLLIYRDSFTDEMKPFLLPHFRKIIFLWGQPYSLDFIRSVKPDLVIESNVSRFINK